MRPLKQGEPRYPVEADAIELLRAQGRYEPPLGQKQRVTARLLAQGAPARRARWVSAPVVIALCLCAAGASAAAGGWVTRGYQVLADSLGNQHSAQAAAPHRAAPKPQRARPVSDHAEAPSVALVPSAETEVPSKPTALPPPTPRVDVTPTASPPSRVVPRAGEARSAAEASNLVVGAMRALRQEGRPDSAAKQLDEYMRRYPSGALAEEALALSVEAATQRGDAHARELADRYLARYPSGRFRRAAERARALFSK
jgi:hypothetical protein